MAGTVALLVIRDAVRRRADQVNSDFRSDADVNDLINRTLAEVYEHIIIQQPERYLSSVTFNTVNGTASYPLTALAYKVKSIDAVFPGYQVPRELDMFQWQDRNRYRLGVGWNYNTPVAWRLYANNIVFAPTPTSVIPITVWYHPLPPTLTFDSDSFDGVAGWDEAIIVGAAWKLALEEADTELSSQLGAEYQRQLARILSFAAVRVTEHTEEARDVYRHGGPDEWGYR